jgi:hypothetical protein
LGRLAFVPVSRALHQPGVQDWLAKELGERLCPAWLDAQIRLRVAAQALAGSIDHQRLWFELQGKLRGQSHHAEPIALTPVVVRIEPGVRTKAGITANEHGRKETHGD